MRYLLPALTALTAAQLTVTAPAQSPMPGEEPAITPPRITQAILRSGSLDLREIRAHGLRMFSTPFNKFDGYGDGPMNPSNPTPPGGRPTLQGNGTFLRVNGLDAQTCMECHSIVSAATRPFTFGIGGVGGANNNAMAGPRTIDVGDTQGLGMAFFDGRFINPPFLFGSGGVELAGKEMTLALQQQKARALANPGVPVALTAKGVSFGTITGRRDGTLDTSQVEGIDDDLVVRPFGRKGEFATTRAFDIEAMMFHFGMQPVERVGANVDDDGDGVVNEVLVGELSALAIFNTNLERPVQERLDARARAGRDLFSNIGCADCHVPSIETDSRWLPHSFPEVDTNPLANIYFISDLSRRPADFDRVRGGGIRVPMFSDLKRHDMGPGLAESTGGPLDRMFITARLWGIADTAPYLHDGRALTISEAILLHGGEAQPARDAFANLGAGQRIAVLAYLRTLRTPEDPARDLVRGGRGDD